MDVNWRNNRAERLLEAVVLTLNYDEFGHVAGQKGNLPNLQ